MIKIDCQTSWIQSSIFQADFGHYHPSPLPHKILAGLKPFKPKPLAQNTLQRKHGTVSRTDHLLDLFWELCLSLRALHPDMYLAHWWGLLPENHASNKRAKSTAQEPPCCYPECSDAWGPASPAIKTTVFVFDKCKLFLKWWHYWLRLEITAV